MSDGSHTARDGGSVPGAPGREYPHDTPHREDELAMPMLMPRHAFAMPITAPPMPPPDAEAVAV